MYLRKLTESQGAKKIALLTKYLKSGQILYLKSWQAVRANVCIIRAACVDFYPNDINS